MTGTTTPAELVVPASAYRAAGKVERDWGLTAMVERAIEQAAPHIVAAELRRIADDGTGWAIATHLRARADQLDGGEQ